MASENHSSDVSWEKRPEAACLNDHITLDLSSLSPRPNREAVEALGRLSELPQIPVDLTTLPARRVAAVLVLLHVNADGGLSVTLTTRSSRLRSHPGDTALPGGRVEDLDDTVITAALRESNEEIGLPLDNTAQYGFLGILAPFVSRNLLIVYPVVYMLLCPAAGFLPRLIANEDEVAHIFHWPLKDILQLHTPEISSPTACSPVHTYRDVSWMNSKPYRWHSISHESIPSPITGLTADILITLATLAFDVKVENLKAPAQEDWSTLVKWALENRAGGPGDEHSLIRRAPPVES